MLLLLLLVVVVVDLRRDGIRVGVAGRRCAVRNAWREEEEVWR